LATVALGSVYAPAAERGQIAPPFGRRQQISFNLCAVRPRRPRELLESNIADAQPADGTLIMDFLGNDPPRCAARLIGSLKQLSPRAMGVAQTRIEDLARRLTAKSHHALILEANADDRGVATIPNPVPLSVSMSQSLF
jgi:hypothetical protein